MLLVHTRDHHTYMVRGRLTMQSRSTCPSAQPHSTTALHMQDFGLWDQPCSLFGVWQVLRREGYGGFLLNSIANVQDGLFLQQQCCIAPWNPGIEPETAERSFRSNAHCDENLSRAHRHSMLRFLGFHP
ncbi:hypothetical protein FOIG_01361 [Fusarium odoratissimum NRRL 54006]|uniref:Uncharacterized protein n=2 Tax=Fusarium oxysporum species complex TaxID=171631 RepID=X0KEE1_FUSO5|nr:uncharacterized protein FOIG_01361 [Fusarium odoratissimum NRRL 54006]EXM11853.1 hypothetical protein FOIG_01361 [Fusarium odoratissimum NRRL 54006]TXC03227.1 hypothetical protein FocTR4_00000789 [Fusarium oxysporum f. sp. cubense]